MKTVIENFTYRDNEFVIVQEGNYYMTIKKEFIKNGRLTKELGYNDGLHTRKTLADCIDATKKELDAFYYMNECGLSKHEAVMKAYGLIEGWN